MYCKNCGGKNSETATFCGNCGKAIEVRDSAASPMESLAPASILPPPNSRTQHSPNQSKSEPKNGKGIIAVVAMLVVMLVAVGAYWMFFLRDENELYSQVNDYTTLGGYEAYASGASESETQQSLDNLDGGTTDGIEEDGEPQETSVIVPDILGVTLAQLESIFASLGIIAEVEFFYNADFDANTVAWIGRVGYAVPPNTSVPVHVSLGAEIPETAAIEYFSDLLGQSTTSTATASANRAHNISRAAELIDGTVLHPGETFSFNNTVGQRTANRGFREGEGVLDGVAVRVMGWRHFASVFNDF